MKTLPLSQLSQSPSPPPPLRPGEILEQFCEPDRNGRERARERKMGEILGLEERGKENEGGTGGGLDREEEGEEERGVKGERERGWAG